MLFWTYTICRWTSAAVRHDPVASQIAPKRQKTIPGTFSNLPLISTRRRHSDHLG